GGFRCHFCDIFGGGFCRALLFFVSLTATEAFCQICEASIRLTRAAPTRGPHHSPGAAGRWVGGPGASPRPGLNRHVDEPCASFAMFAEGDSIAPAGANLFCVREPGMLSPANIRKPSGLGSRKGAQKRPLRKAKPFRFSRKLLFLLGIRKEVVSS